MILRYHFIVKDIFAQQLLDGNQQILAFFVKKSLYNLVNWSYFHIFASRRVSLKERNTFLLNNPRLFYYSCGITPQYNSYKY
ncbi:hypothetical protein F3F64_17700 [Bacteroides ovatus]|nr:hypothetical protein F3F64_17700 [Bacteroides ovatus]KAA3929962.1 hypothetical protein F3F50_23405 [Bacteroides ovatus]